jgi:hypothetical protein
MLTPGEAGEGICTANAPSKTPFLTLPRSTGGGNKAANILLTSDSDLACEARTALLLGTIPAVNAPQAISAKRRF